MDVLGARTIPTLYDQHKIVSALYVIIELESGFRITATYPESEVVSAVLTLTSFIVLSN